MLDADSRALLERIAAAGAPPVWASTPPAAREAFRARQALAPPGPPMRRVRDAVIPGRDGRGVPARLFEPEDAGAPPATLLFLHGGGWVLGDLDGFEPFARRLAAATRATVVLADYRLAPEHPYPAALHDAIDALTWAATSRGGELPDGPLAVLGDSAGGNLAAAAMRHAVRDGTRVDACVLVYPVVDHDFGTASYLDEDNQLLVDARAMRWFWDRYVPDAARRDEPDAAPLRADLGELAGFPPTLVIAAEHDVLLDEGRAYAERLRTAGVAVEYRLFAGQMHGFFTNAFLPVGEQALREAARWLAERLGAARP